MDLLHFALRDEIVNFHAMAKGGLPGNYSHQIFICKKKPLKNKEGVPFLLDQKQTKSTRFNLSKVGEWYHEKVRGEILPLKYVAFIDLQIEINVNFETFEALSENGFFSVWTPTAPLDYFEKHQTGYLVVFRVYEIEREIKESFLFKGRAGKNYLYGLTEDQPYTVCEPVIDNQKFDQMKQDLLSLLKSRGSFVDLFYDYSLKLLIEI